MSVFTVCCKVHIPNAKVLKESCQLPGTCISSVGLNWNAKQSKQKNDLELGLGKGLLFVQLSVAYLGGGGAWAMPPLVDDEKSIYNNMLRPLRHAGNHKIYCMPPPPPPTPSQIVASTLLAIIHWKWSDSQCKNNKHENMQIFQRQSKSGFNVHGPMA